METYNCSANSTYSDPSAAAHGTCGPLKIGLPRVLEKGVGPQIEALRDAGEAVNLDPNDGDVLGVSVFPWSYSEGGRQSSAIAHLCEERGNLEVWTGARVERLVWEGGRVVGVVCGDGRGGMFCSYYGRWDCTDVTFSSIMHQRSHPHRRRNRHAQTPAAQWHRAKTRARRPRYKSAKRHTQHRQASLRPRNDLHERRSRRLHERSVRLRV